MVLVNSSGAFLARLVCHAKIFNPFRRYVHNRVHLKNHLFSRLGRRDFSLAKFGTVILQSSSNPGSFAAIYRVYQEIRVKQEAWRPTQRLQQVGQLF